MNKLGKKIAVLSPAAWRTPPRRYGAWETVAGNIADGLVVNGWDVTLFATRDSITTAKLHAVIDKGYEEDPAIDAKVAEYLHISGDFRARRGLRPDPQPLRLHGTLLESPRPDTGSDHNPRLLVTEDHAGLREISRRLLRFDQ